MIIRRLTRNLVVCAIGVSLFNCKPEDIILHFDVTGSVTDASDNVPINDASLILIPLNDTTLTGQDGIYLFKNLTPGNYELQASKIGYKPDSKSFKALQDSIYNIDFGLKAAPVPYISCAYLDFGFDSISLKFTISNSGKGKFSYLLIKPNQEWISVHPSSGEVTDESDNISVTINRSGLPEKTFKESLRIFSVLGEDSQLDTIQIYLNGIMDTIANYYYKAVRIGTQIWMAENLNCGEMILSYDNQSDNQIIEKYCYDNNSENCKIYGGLYQWDEMMQYNSSEEDATGTEQGICPVGWHVPTNYEVDTLISYLGGSSEASIKMKDTGTTHWLPSPDTEATNESGFTAIPGGEKYIDNTFSDINLGANWWLSEDYHLLDSASGFGLWYNDNLTFLYSCKKVQALSVRCIKDEQSR
jgi:uncharacterized protein (TIGR02145 family)